MSISSIDFAILVVYLLAMVVFGLWVGRDQKDLAGYLLGGRDMPWWSILGSIVATETSTATFLSVPGIAFAIGGDLRFLQLGMGLVVGRIIVAIVLVPLFRRGEIYSAYEILSTRFGGASKQCASLMFLITRNLGDGLRLFLAGIALEKVLGIDLIGCIVILGFVTILYTFFGGIKAVIWSDCIQWVVYMVGGILSLQILVSYFPGGWGQLFEFGNQTGRFQVFDFRLRSTDTFSVLTDPYTFWAGVFGGTVLTLGTHGTDQMIVQRYLAARSTLDAQRAVVVSGLVVLAQFALFLIVGVALACFYSQINPQTFDHHDEVFAEFIVDHLPVGLVGITLAAVFAAAMSTLSSSLNSSASAAVSDFYRPWFYPKGDEPSVSGDLVRVSRRLTVFFGLVQIAIGIGASYLSSSVISDALAIAGFTAGILLGIFMLGILTSSAHQRGALVGMLTGIVTLTVIKFATPVAWPWLAIIGSVTTFVSGYLASHLIPPSRPKFHTGPKSHTRSEVHDAK